MRQAFRRYAFPMMIIAAVLAAALPLNSFALNLSTVNLYDDFSVTALNFPNWSYLNNVTNSSVPFTYFDSDLRVSYAVSDPDHSLDASFNSIPVLTRYAWFNISTSSGIRTYRFDLPIFLDDIFSIDFDFFFSCTDQAGSLIPGAQFSSIILHTNDTSIDIPISISSSDISLSTPSYLEWRPTDLDILNYSISYSSTASFDANYISFYFSVDHSRFQHYCLSFSLYPNVSVSTLSSNISSLMEGQELIVRLLDTSIAQDNYNNAVIVERLDQILAAVESGGGSGGSGSDPGTGEGEDILQEGAIKQEQLEQLGDALSNVPKPSIENITQSFDPADTLISADPGMIQNALSIVYSWDKFLILLGLFIAVGTISYIIFGKKI